MVITIPAATAATAATATIGLISPTHRLQHNTEQVGIAATLKGDNQTIVWSNSHGENVSYIEDTFRVVASNKTNNHAGIVWVDGNNKEYYAFLRSNWLTIATLPEGELASAQLAKPRDNGKWFRLNVTLH